MLSVIVPTHNSERALFPSLAALVPGALDGLISELILADCGSTDDTAAIADVAGCKFLVAEGLLGRRLKSAAAAARAPWLLFLRPGIVLDGSWVGETRRWVERPGHHDKAAVFRRAVPSQATLRNLVVLLASSLGARPRPEQGLLLPHQFYDTLGGHREDDADPERDLIRRIGRRRIVRLSTTVSVAAQNT